LLSPAEIHVGGFVARLSAGLRVTKFAGSVWNSTAIRTPESSQIPDRHLHGAMT